MGRGGVNHGALELALLGPEEQPGRGTLDERVEVVQIGEEAERGMGLAWTVEGGVTGRAGILCTR